MTAATIGIGLVAGWMTLPLVSKIMPAAWRSEIESPTTWGKARGLINVAIGVALFTLLKNKHAKQIGMVVAGTGIYDLIAVNVPQLGLPSLPAQNSGLDNLMPAASGTYDSIGVHAASAMAGNPHASQAIAGSYGPANAVVPAYGPSAYGSSYESSLMKSFGDDLDAFMN